MFREKNCRENQNTFLCSITFLFSKNRAVYEKMWKHLVEPDRPKMAIRRMSIACWIPGAIDTPSENEILIFLLLQKKLGERASC
jgi:hypothetical protein